MLCSPVLPRPGGLDRCGDGLCGAGGGCQQHHHHRLRAPHRRRQQRQQYFSRCLHFQLQPTDRKCKKISYACTVFLHLSIMYVATKRGGGHCTMYSTCTQRLSATFLSLSPFLTRSFRICIHSTSPIY
jgi:hypothetical protein